VATLLAKTFRLLNQLRRGRVDRKAFANNCLKEFSYSHGLLWNLGKPCVFQLETTNHCPYTCTMCPRTYGMTRPLGHMDFALFRCIIDQLRPAWQVSGYYGEPTIKLFHFGEPMVYVHYVESIAYCHEKGLRVCISTNPSVWSERRIDETLDVGLDEMFVVVDGMDDETSMAIRGRAASFTRGHKNVLQLVRKKIQRGLRKPLVSMLMVRQLRNANQWEAFKSYWKTVEGVDGITLTRFSTFSSDLVQINDISKEFEAENTAQAEWKAAQDDWSHVPCYYPWHSVSVTWDGKVVPCCRDYNKISILGDLTKQSLSEVWNGPAMRQLRREFNNGKLLNPLCATCQERSMEIGLPGAFYPMPRSMRDRLTRSARVTREQ
jgi:radical SAM protein with 4Fe4S-binding SPASM domain